MSVIRVTGSTMGVSTPATVADGTAKPYRYRGRPGWTPGCDRDPADQPPRPLPQNLKTIAGKQARIAEYIRLRLDDVDKYEAAKELGVTRSTRVTYEKAFSAYQEQQRGEGAS